MDTTTTGTTEAATMAPTNEIMKPKRTRRRRGRRLNGEGTIYQHTDGRWRAAVTVGGSRRKYLYGATAEAVRVKLNAEIEAKAKGLPTGDERLTVGMFLEKFLDERRPRTRPQTMQHYENAVRRHLVPAIGHIRLRKLTAADVQAFLDKKRTEVVRVEKREGAEPIEHKMSPTMVRHLRTVLKMALKLAADWDLVVRNVGDRVRPPKLAQKKIDPLDAAETRKFLDVARTHPLGAIWLIVATLGLRRGEVLGLRWNDIDLERGMLSVRVQLMRLRGEKEGDDPRIELVEPKSKNAVRDLKLAPVVIDALKRRKSDQAAQRLRLGEAGGTKGDDMGLIFTTQDGRPLVGGAVSSTHSVLLRKAGVRRVRFHDLRHGAASLMLEAGVDPRTLSETLGHSRVGFTLDTYAHVKRPRLDDAVDRLAAVLLPSRG
jgi:integrase